MSITKDDLLALGDAERDVGEEPADMEFTDEQRKIISLIMATQATLLQFIDERILRDPDEPHLSGV